MSETPIDAAVAAFLRPSEEEAAWLADTRFDATLAAASADLAPDGQAMDTADRYAASIIATHLEARRRLARLMSEAIEA